MPVFLGSAQAILTALRFELLCLENDEVGIFQPFILEYGGGWSFSRLNSPTSGATGLVLVFFRGISRGGAGSDGYSFFNLIDCTFGTGGCSGS
jgi:hypothetical protein